MCSMAHDTARSQPTTSRFRLLLSLSTMTHLSQSTPLEVKHEVSLMDTPSHCVVSMRPLLVLRAMISSMVQGMGYATMTRTHT
ncbi:hypothetical protein IWZ01DRAFT_490465 [Phyllosticta capitalensis]